MDELRENIKCNDSCCPLAHACCPDNGQLSGSMNASGAYKAYCEAVREGACRRRTRSFDGRSGRLYMYA